jgi:hypothetical protein
MNIFRRDVAAKQYDVDWHPVKFRNDLPKGRGFNVMGVRNKRDSVPVQGGIYFCGMEGNLLIFNPPVA